MLRHSLLILFACMVSVLNSRAQPLPPLLDEYHARAFDVNDGLPASYIIGLAQTPDHYLYVATAHGLVRFDGHTFHPVALSGFQSSYIDKLYKDQQDRLWILTQKDELGYIDQGIFHAIPSASLVLHDFSDTSDGAVWLGSDSGLVRVLPEADNSITRFTTAHGLPSDSVSGVFDLPDGQRVVATHRQLARVEEDVTQPDGLRFIPFGPSYELTWTYNHSHVDARGLWLGLRDGALQYDDGEFVHYSSQGNVPALHIDSLAWKREYPSSLARSLEYNVHFEAEDVPLDGILRVRHALLTSDGTRWVAVIEGDPAQEKTMDFLVRQRGGQSEIVPLRSQLNFEQILNLLEDHEGNLWVGTDRGLIQLAQRKVFALTGRHGLAETMTVPILQTRDNALWVGTWGKGLYRFANGGLANHYSTVNGLPVDKVRALYEASDGTLWVGMRASLAAIRDGQVVLSEKLRGHEVHSFAETPDGTLWIGTRGRLLFRTPQGFADYRPEYWYNNAVWALHTAKDGALWIASERGLFQLAEDTLHTFSEPGGLHDPYVVSIYEEDDGTLWFGTFEQGLIRYRDGHFAVVTTQEGLHYNGVWRMLQDRFGGIWMSSDQGVFRVDYVRLHAVADAIEQGKRPETRLTPLVFTEVEGMPNRECNRAFPGGWQLNDGRLLFNNVEGVVVIDPSRALASRPSPRTIIHEVVADGQLVLSHSPEVSDMPPGTKHITFEFAALSFAAPSQTRYRYRLDGYDSAWLDTDRQRRASYTNLAPGRYTFHVQGLNGSSTWSDPGAAYTFNVQPFLWQRSWFQLLVVAMGLALLIGAYKYRVYHLVQVERTRQRISADLHDDIGGSLTSIALFLEMAGSAQRIEVGDKRRLRELAKTTRQLVDDLRDTVWIVDTKNDHLSNLITRMQQLADHASSSPVVRFPAPEHVPDLPLKMELRRHLLLIYKEALNNALRHAEATQIDVTITYISGLFAFAVMDDGIGFDTSSVFQGRGLKNFRARADEIGGNLQIESQLGHGTSIRLSIKLA